MLTCLCAQEITDAQELLGKAEALWGRCGSLPSLHFGQGWEDLPAGVGVGNDATCAYPLPQICPVWSIYQTRGVNEILMGQADL